MPRFFIETDDGDNVVFDDEGVVVGSNQMARDLALGALPEMAKDKLPDGDERTFTVTVYDDKRQPVYVATLSLKGVWLKGNDPLAT